MNTKIALIPAYEPAETLSSLVQQLTESGFEIVVVNDGSSVACLPVFATASAHATVLTHQVNKGKGRALKTGLAYIRENFPEHAVIVTLDADGQHTIEDAIKVCNQADAKPEGLFLGSRRFKGDVPVRSRFGNAITRLVFRLITGKSIHDTQTGLRAFSISMIPLLLNISGERYEYEMNVLLECSRKQIPIHEIEIETIYLDHNVASHFDTVKDSFRIYHEIGKFAASSFTGFLVDYSMYSLLVLLTGGLGTSVSVPLSNILARITSSSVNYTINKRLVFKSKDSILKTGIQYFILVACILFGNTMLLSHLVNSLQMNKFAAKLITEITFFTLSWVAQRFFIFRKKADAKFKGRKLPAQFH